MSYDSQFIFDSGDWLHPLDNGAQGLFTRSDYPWGGATPANRWFVFFGALVVVRDDNEILEVNNQQLYDVFNTEDIYQKLTQAAANASKKLPPLFNVYFRPPVGLSFAYQISSTQGSVLGPGRDQGGLPYIPDKAYNTPILTVNVYLHINTPPGMASIDATLVLYLYLYLDNQSPRYEILGTAHPWHFNRDGYNAFQDEINLGLEDAANSGAQQLQTILDSQLSLIPPLKDFYLVPGSAIPRQPDRQPIRDGAMNYMTLAVLLAQ